MEPTPRIERGSVAYHATALPLSYADSKYRYFRHACSVWPAIRNIPRLVWIVNGRGIRSRFIPASSGVRSPFVWLHFWQAATRFSQRDNPPCAFGIT